MLNPMETALLPKSLHFARVILTELRTALNQVMYVVYYLALLVSTVWLADYLLGAMGSELRLPLTEEAYAAAVGLLALIKKVFTV